MFRKLLRALAAGRGKTPSRASLRPSLEPLEDRTVPIAVQTFNAAQLPAALSNVLAGSGIKITSASYTGSSFAAGTFANGRNEVGFDTGIVLDTGLVADIPGKNTNPPGGQGFIGTNLGQPGDPAISALIGQPTFDAASLNISIVSQGPQVVMNFVFASNEFNRIPPRTASGFDDTFIVTVNGPANNVAVLPNGQIVNPRNVLNNFGIYRDNVPGGAGTNGPIDIRFNGETSILTLTFNVTPGVVNSLHISIADEGDTIRDSAVFIQGHSLATPARLTTAFPTTWVYNPANQTYVGYLTVLNVGPNPLTGNLQLVLQNLPPGVFVSPLSTAPPGVWLGNVYQLNNIFILPNQTIRVAVKISNPLHQHLPTYFNTAGVRIIPTLF